MNRITENGKKKWDREKERDYLKKEIEPEKEKERERERETDRQKEMEEKHNQATEEKSSSPCLLKNES